jgi:N-acetylglucosamine PTS system EIIB component
VSQAEAVLAGLGGVANLVELEACTTRLRATLLDTALVDETALRAAGSHAITRTGSVVEVTVGPDAATITRAIEGLL